MPLRDDPDGMMRERIDRTVKSPVGKPSIPLEKIREAVRAARDRRIEQLTSRDEQRSSKPPRSELPDLLAEFGEDGATIEEMGRP